MKSTELFYLLDVYGPILAGLPHVLNTASPGFYEVTSFAIYKKGHMQQ
jgi:hypothetical protein